MNEERDTLWSRFRRRKAAVGGLSVIAALAAVAGLAPFIAGNRPIVLVEDGVWRSPVFEAFSAEDFVWFGGLGAAAVAWGANLLLKRVRPGLDARARRRGAAAFFVATLAAILAAGALWPERLVHEDFRALREGTGTADFRLFPPIPFAPREVPLQGSLEPPGSRNWLGTDREGDDVLARIVHGTRVSLAVALVAVVICVLAGVLLGAVAGYFGGLADGLVLRLIEVVICFPAFFAVLAVLAFLPPRIFWVMLIIGLVRWPGVARLTRGEFLRLKGVEYVTAARAMGLSPGRIIVRHMLPNALAPVIVAASFAMAGAILIESGLSFLGIGPASCQSWGRLLSEFRPYFDVAWWLSVFPGAAIFVTVTAFNLVGEGLRDALDPRLRE